MRPEFIPVLIVWPVLAIWVTISILVAKKQHPKALFQLFMVEIWERFSYYGMRAVLVIYLVATVTGNNPGIGMTKPEAYALYAGFAGLVYLTPLIGGRLADQILGARRAITLGAALMAAGQFLLSMSLRGNFFLIAGLASLIVGNGFFKPNIQVLLGKLYPAGDNRRDVAFSIFYMGINVGALLAPLTCGALGVVYGRTYAFMLAGIFMLLGLVIFIWSARTGSFGTLADPPVSAKGGVKLNTLLVYVGAFVAIPVMGWLMQKSAIMDVALALTVLGMMTYLIWLSTKYEGAQRKRLWAIPVLFVFTSTFWCFFELAGSVLAVFTDQNVQKQFLGATLTAEGFASFNSAFVVMLAQAFATMWLFLGKRNMEPSIPVKFGLGLILLGSGFFLLKAGVPFAVAGMMPAIFMVGMYFLHTLGELSISPVGNALVTKLAPPHIGAFIMGFWMLAISVGTKIGGHISCATVASANATLTETMLQSIQVFNKVGMFAVCAGVVLFALRPVLNNWMRLDQIGKEAPAPSTLAEELPDNEDATLEA